MPLHPEHGEFIATFMYKHSGLILGRKKYSIIENRLEQVAKQVGMPGADCLCETLRRGGNPQLESLVVDALTVHETFWFRDRALFDALSRVYLPWWQKRHPHRYLKIWSAGCSTGQEPYSLVMAFLENGWSPGWKGCWVATDVSRNVIQKARKGIYSALELSRGLPAFMRTKYFQPLENGAWQIKKAVRKHVRFQRQNVLTDAPPIRPLNIILCRNVLIYFSRSDKARLLEQLHRLLAPMGLLALGATETTVGICGHFQPIRIGGAVFYARTEDVPSWQASEIAALRVQQRPNHEPEPALCRGSGATQSSGEPPAVHQRQTRGR